MYKISYHLQNLELWIISILFYYYFFFPQDEHMHPFFQQGVEVSGGCQFEDILILIITSFALFIIIQVTPRNCINKEYCHVSIKIQHLFLL